jgi:16S rRNA (cytosine1402-N4)-methyltransferase
MGDRAMGCGTPHVSVLLNEALGALDVAPGGLYIDGTVGAGGHAESILRASAPDGLLLGFDADPQALQVSRKRLAPFKERVTLVHSNYVHLKEQAEILGFVPDGILLDLGVSSMQLARAERGFSFQLDGPLDMRFDPGTSRTAADVVNTFSEHALADVIYRYGEEPASRSIARAIVAARPIYTTTELAEVIQTAVKRRGKIHPATRTFQALRIVTNDELAVLEQGLSAAVSLLKPGGRLAVISFHSLEDRIVKAFFAREARDCVCPPETMVCVCDHQAALDVVTRKPIRPSSQEVDQNPRSRSARLRAAAKR